jgi:copper chaperone CopZ
VKIKRKVIFPLFIVLSVIFLSACGSKTTSTDVASKTATAANVESAQFTVTGMYCASCPYVVKSAIERVDGVYSIEMTEKGDTGIVDVKFDQSKTDITSIKNTVLELGYGVKGN